MFFLLTQIIIYNQKSVYEINTSVPGNHCRFANCNGTEQVWEKKEAGLRLLQFVKL
jgi:hypothetical protein